MASPSARVLTTSLAVMASLGVFVSPASAGTYTVLSCKDRAGARAPLNDSTGGWIPENTGGPGLDTVDNCAGSSQGFQATISGSASHPPATQVWWRFVPPSGTSIAGADVLWSGTT